MLVLLLLGLGVFARGHSPVAVLESLGYTSFASALASATDIDTSQTLTIFAPDNAAFTNSANLSYHVLPGIFYDNNTALVTAVSPSVTVGRTLLTNNLENGKGQVVVWTRTTADSPMYFLNQNPQITISNSTLLSNLFVVQINGVLSPPKDLASTFSDTTLNLTSLAGIASMVMLPSFYPTGTNATLSQALSADQTKGYTLFAPHNDALKEATDVLAGLANNATALLALLGNHYINGSSYYSPTLLSPSPPPNAFISSSGQPFSFTTNSSGAYVISSNKASAKIIKSDVLLSNGVIHVIDRVLVNTDVDEARARDAYESARKGTEEDETGPLGPLRDPEDGVKPSGALALHVSLSVLVVTGGVGYFFL